MIAGIRPPEKKDLVLVTWTIARPKRLANVRIFLDPDPERQVRLTVQSGTCVKQGQTIAAPEAAGAVARHASIAGTVVDIGRSEHPVLGEAQFIEIKPEDELFPSPPEGLERANWTALGPEELLDIFRMKGLVNLDTLMTPVHTKLLQMREAQADCLVINACESEPYSTNEHALLMSHPMEILKGAEILRHVAGATRIVIAIEDTKIDPIEVLRSKIFFLKWDHVEVKVLPARYPQGNAAVLARDFNVMTTAVFNSATTYAVYEAVVMQKPLIERTVTVGGECVIEPRNLWLPIGTTAEQAIKACRGLMRDPRKVLLGGPMTGTSIAQLGEAILPGTGAVLALPGEIARPTEAQACTRCHECVDVCPAEISPAMITLAAEQDLFERAAEEGIDACIECGNCAYVCPSKRPMLELIRYAATHLEIDFEDESWNPLEAAPQKETQPRKPVILQPQV